MSTSFPGLVGKVVSSVDFERFDPDEGAAEDIKAVRIQFNDGSWIKLEPRIRSQGNPLNPGIIMSMVGPPPPLYPNDVQIKGGGSPR